MASFLVSITFCTPLSAPKFSIKELQPRTAALTRFLSQATARTAINILVSSNSHRTMVPVYQSCCEYLATPTDHFLRLSSCRKCVSSCTHKRITGYWVGPDIDDGWGYVEAFLN